MHHNICVIYKNNKMMYNDVSRYCFCYTSFKRTDKVKPIITIILYYGSSEWDTNLTLYDMFGIENEEKEILSKYVPDYKINLINPSKMG